jgi:hypothetical protein
MTQEYELYELEDLEDLEDEGLFEDYEDYEDYEDFEDYEDLEGDPFIGKWFKKAKQAVSRVARGPLGGVLKGLARKAAQVAGGAIGGPAGASIAGAIANRVIRESEFEGEYEMEGDFEAEFEAEGGDLEVLGEMEYLSEMAAEAESEAEADQFIGAIANLAGSLLPSLIGEMEDHEDYEDYEDESDMFFPALIPLAASLLPKAIPWIKKGVSAVGKVINSSPRTRPILKALPKIAARTALSVARKAQQKGRITPKQVAASVAHATAKTLATKKNVAKAMRPTVIPARAVSRVPARNRRPIGVVPRQIAMRRRCRQLMRRPVRYYR